MLGAGRKHGGGSIQQREEKEQQQQRQAEHQEAPILRGSLGVASRTHWLTGPQREKSIRIANSRLPPAARTSPGS